MDIHCRLLINRSGASPDGVEYPDPGPVFGSKGRGGGGGLFLFILGGIKRC